MIILLHPGGVLLNTLVLAQAARTAAQGEILIVAPVLRQHFDLTRVIATTDFLANDLLYDSLLNSGADGKYSALATSWKVSAAGKQIDFKPRKDIVIQVLQPGEATGSQGY